MHNGNQFKLIKYDYDLISGKVNQVSYQPGKTDAFYHQYAYDAENRITEVFTSRDSTEWQHDADYQTPLMTSLVSYDITHKWYYYSGANNEGHRPGWYSQQDYEASSWIGRMVRSCCLMSRRSGITFLGIIHISPAETYSVRGLEEIGLASRWMKMAI